MRWIWSWQQLVHICCFFKSIHWFWRNPLIEKDKYWHQLRLGHSSRNQLQQHGQYGAWKSIDGLTKWNIFNNLDNFYDRVLNWQRGGICPILINQDWSQTYKPHYRYELVWQWQETKECYSDVNPLIIWIPCGINVKGQVTRCSPRKLILFNPV